jgi:hypothetical protein
MDVRRTWEPPHLYLLSNVKVAVDGQHRTLEVLDGFGEEFICSMLKEPLEEKLCRGCQKCVLAVRRADVLEGQDGS